MNFVIHWNETAMGLHVFPIPISPPTSLSTRSLWVFPVHQVRALVSCIQPGLVICFTLDNIPVSMLFSWNIPPSPSPTESKRLLNQISLKNESSFQSVSSVTQSCLTLCNPMDCSTPGPPVHHQLPEFTQIHVHWVGDAIQPSHPPSSPSPLTFNLSQHLGLFKWVSSSHQVAKRLKFQLQHQSFQWTPRTDLL